MRAKNAPWGQPFPTQQTSQIPAAPRSQSKIKPNLQPQAKAVVKYLTLSPKHQSARFISGPRTPEPLLLPMNAPRGKTFLLFSQELGALHLPEKSSTPAQHKRGTTIRSSPLTFTFDVWIAGPQNLSTILQPQSCGFISAFERGMLLRLGEGTVLRSRERPSRPQTTWDGQHLIAPSLKHCLSLEACSSNGTYRCHDVTAVGTFVTVMVRLLVRELLGHYFEYALAL